MNELEFLGKIGKGATSVVYEVKLCNRLVAAKKVGTDVKNVVNEKINK